MERNLLILSPNIHSMEDYEAEARKLDNFLLEYDHPEVQAEYCEVLNLNKHTRVKNRWMIIEALRSSSDRPFVFIVHKN